MGVLQRFQHHEVEAVRFGRYNLGINSSCIIYRLGDTLIDTGPPNQWRHVRRFLAERKPTRALLTHHHEDHSGNAAAIQKRWSATVLIQAEGLAPVRQGFELKTYQRIVWGMPARFEGQAAPAEIFTDSGLCLKTLHAPGHSPDMTCYLAPDRGWLFSGDQFLAARPKYFRADENFDQEVASLRFLLQQEFQTMFCAHRGLVEDGHTKLREKLTYLLAMRERAHDLRRRGRSVTDITRTLLGKEDGTSFVSRGHLCKANMIRACLSSTPSSSDDVTGA